MAKKILVIEDDSITRKSLQVALLNLGFEADEAPNGAVGLEKALATHPDLILTDIMMPELDGFEMIKKIREDEWGKDARIIILTSNETADAVNMSLKLGVYTYFSKDMMDSDEIAAQIQQTTGQA